MSGTINLALTQQFDTQGDPLSGGLLYFFAAGSTTPQNVFQDTSLTILHPNPLVLDASGRVPMFYLSDGFIKIRLTDKNGVGIIAADQLLVIGPSSGGGGGGGTSDVTQLLQTGDIKSRYSTIALDGFVRLNGNTIGNVGSSATERQEAVCQPLFEYLWAFPNITLEGFAKTGSALADWGLGRRMILPDLRGRGIVGLDDMGAAGGAATRLTTPFFGVSATQLGNVGGNEKHILTVAELAAHTHSNATTLTTLIQNEGISVSVGGTTLGSNASGYNLAHTHNYTLSAAVLGGVSGGGTAVGVSGTTTTGGNNESLDHAHTFSGSGSVTSNHTHNFNFTTNNGNGVSGSAFAVANPAMVLTFYMKM